MAISAYVGVPGSGKSYEVVKSVIVPAIQAGRRIVTNIVGINVDEIIHYLTSQKNTAKGQLIVVTDDQVLAPGFFPFKGAISSFCQAGDLIVIDEIWRVWDGDKGFTDEQRSFISEHRHFVNEQGHTSDLVIINQSLDTVPRFLKSRIETTFKMTKLKALGLHSRYRVDVFVGTKLFKSNRSTYQINKYDKRIFKLYSSYDATHAIEQVVDKRQSLIGKKGILLILLSLVLFAFLLYRVISFFTVKPPVNVPSVHASVAVPVMATEALSSTWCIAGTLYQAQHNYVVLKNNAGQLRLVSRSHFTGTHYTLQGHVDNQWVTLYSCTQSNTGAVLPSVPS